VRQVEDLSTWSRFPAYVKAPVGTGSFGVRRAVDRAELTDAVEHFIADGALADGGVLVQEAVVGTFVMAQCVFDAGSLVAFHVNERTQEGANGSAAAKTSTHVPLLRDSLEKLGRQLDWHGALSVDAIVDGGQPFVIDVNPRLVEPGNAMAAGTDMVGALLGVASGRPSPVVAPSRRGVRTHQLLMAILGAAQRTGTRRKVVRELVRAATKRGVYADSHEELMPWHGDRRTILLPTAAVMATLVRPSLWKLFTDGAVTRYALAPEGWRQLRDTPAFTGPFTPSALVG
jgi:biotin carboxylase